MVNIPYRISAKTFKQALAKASGQSYVGQSIQKKLGGAEMRKIAGGAHPLYKGHVTRDQAVKIIKALQKQGDLKKYRTANEFLGEAVKREAAAAPKTLIINPNLRRAYQRVERTKQELKERAKSTTSPQQKSDSGQTQPKSTPAQSKTSVPLETQTLPEMPKPDVESAAETPITEGEQEPPQPENVMPAEPAEDKNKEESLPKEPPKDLPID